MKRALLGAGIRYPRRCRTRRRSRQRDGADRDCPSRSGPHHSHPILIFWSDTLSRSTTNLKTYSAAGEVLDDQRGRQDLYIQSARRSYLLQGKKFTAADWSIR